ncbi:hypothetical protein ACQ3I4_08525 [Zafaria sp. Z1313]|uniref:hypothetical protein n=1 Tax=unclassified Zafaria TaxID=2828765 RepID=UPI002E76A3E9|nr:hypothetical protein [Zafaria sp. J156]MEE1620951.1 hypothetical protein [Zafaria sp. J156]
MRSAPLWLKILVTVTGLLVLAASFTGLAAGSPLPTIAFIGAAGLLAYLGIDELRSRGARAARARDSGNDAGRPGPAD